MTIRDVEDRLRSVVEGRGADGSLGALALARAATLERFRTTNTNDPGSLDGSAFDRATTVVVTGQEDLVPRNVHCNEIQLRVTLEVRVAYAAAPALSDTVHDEAVSDRADAAAHWTTRALDDARELDRALTWYELTGNDTVPVIERVAPQGFVTTQDLGNGRGIMIRRYEIHMEDTQ